MTKIIDGKKFAAEICKKLAIETQSFKKQYNITPGLLLFWLAVTQQVKFMLVIKIKKRKI